MEGHIEINSDKARKGQTISFQTWGNVSFHDNEDHGLGWQPAEVGVRVNEPDGQKTAWITVQDGWTVQLSRSDGQFEEVKAECDK